MDDKQRVARAQELLRSAQEQNKVLLEQLDSLTQELQAANAAKAKAMEELAGWQRDERFEEKWRKQDAVIAELQTELARLRSGHDPAAAMEAARSDVSE